MGRFDIVGLFWKEDRVCKWGHAGQYTETHCSEQEVRIENQVCWIAGSGSGPCCDGDAGMFVLGMFSGAGISHTFNMASSAAGPGPYGPLGVAVGVVFCVLIGLFMREPAHR